MHKMIFSIGCVMIFYIFGHAADLKVKKITQLTSVEDDGVYYYPRFASDDSKVFFTKSNFVGLLYYDLHQNEIVELNDDPGAGYQPVFTADGETVYYRTYNYVNRRKYSSIVEQNIAGGQKNVLINNKRNLTTPRLLISGNLLMLDNSEIEKLSLVQNSKNVSVAQETTDNPVVFVENTDIVLVQNGIKKILEPIGSGNYIWPSVSPDRTRLLFTKVGEGTYITDLDGTNPLNLGMANAPQWSPDGAWIIYMVDRDDGYMVLESDIYVVNSNGSQMIKLTNTDDRIEMYPAWSGDMTRIVFSTDRGEIFLMELETE